MHLYSNQNTIISIKSSKVKNNVKIQPNKGFGATRGETEFTIRHDPIPIEQSVLNNRKIVSNDIGITKKIYIRRDKFNFQSSRDIFELREMRARDEEERK